MKQFMFEISFRNRDFSFYVKTSYFSEESKTLAEGRDGDRSFTESFLFVALTSRVSASAKEFKNTSILDEP